MISLLENNSGIFGLLAFFGFFVSVIIRLYRPGAKQVYDRFANIPLMEDARDK